MGMQLDKKSPDALQFITSLLGTLEGVKKQLAANDAITNEVFQFNAFITYILRLLHNLT